MHKTYRFALFAGALMLAAALPPTAMAAEAVPLSVGQDEHKLEGCQANYIYANQNGPDLHTIGAACGVFSGFTLAASTDYSHGFGAVMVNGNIALGEIAGFTTIASVGIVIPRDFGDSFASTGTFDLAPALTIYDDNFLGPLGVGAQYSGRIAMDKNALAFALPDRHTAKGWVSAHLDDNFNLYGILIADFYGTPDVAVCGECKTAFSSSTQINAGGGANLFVGPVRFSVEGTATVDNSPFGRSGRKLMLGARLKL